MMQATRGRGVEAGGGSVAVNLTAEVDTPVALG